MKTQLGKILLALGCDGWWEVAMIGLGCGEAANICDTLYPVADILLYTAILVYRLVSGRARQKLYAMIFPWKVASVLGCEARQTLHCGDWICQHFSYLQYKVKIKWIIGPAHADWGPHSYLSPSIQLSHILSLKICINIRLKIFASTRWQTSPTSNMRQHQFLQEQTYCSAWSKSKSQA